MTSTTMTFDLRNMIDSSFEDLLLDSFNPSFKVKKYTYHSKKNEDKTWYTLQYKKEMLNEENISTIGQIRSVVTDGEKVYVYSPPKSISFDAVSKLNYSNFEVEELVEGTMMNLFWNDHNEDWEISTKSSVGAKYSFNQDNRKTFRAMFLEAMNTQDLDFNQFDPNLCYSFVLQHPENRLVVPFSKPQLVLVGLYKISGSEITILDKRTCLIENIVFPKQLNEFCDYNTLYTGDDDCWSNLHQYFNQLNMDYKIVGINIYNRQTNQRAKIRNPSYEYVRKLKGNSPKLQYQYYNLRRLGKVKEYLQFYPEHRVAFSDLRQDLHVWTEQLWQNYRACYVQKEKPVKEYPKKFKTHMYHLHQIYLNDLREMGHYISKQVVIKYVNSLEPARLMFVINFDQRRAKQEEASMVGH